MSYFTDSKAAKGSKSITASVDGITYRFASEAHKSSFEKEPQKYMPAYGGWCATAMAEGDKVKINPKYFKITDGRLFLFYKGILANAKKDWDKNEAKLKGRADAEWKKLIAE